MDNLSIQDILPTWQWQVDITEVKVGFDFNESYTGGSSVKIEAKKHVKLFKIPLYKTALTLTGKEVLNIACKGVGELQYMLYTNDGSKHAFHVKLDKVWNENTIDLSELKGLMVNKIEIEFSGSKGDMVYLGALAIRQKSSASIKKPKVTITPFKNDDSVELYVHIEGDKQAEFHNIYRIKNGKKIWLGKTRSTDYYVAPFKINKNQKTIEIQVVSVSKNNSSSRPSLKKVRVK